MEEEGMSSSQGPRSSARISVQQLLRGSDAQSFANDVRTGLGTRPKSLPPKYFYDELGSQLFEAICRLPEYYLTRAESEILRNHSDEIVGSVRGPVRLVELGSGSSEKTRFLIEALLRRQSDLHYLPVDISAASLEFSSSQLAHAYPRLKITGYNADYFTALRAIKEQRPGGYAVQGTIALFLGSNIGNFDPAQAAEFLSGVRKILNNGDGLLIGADLKKPAEILLPAYNDELGVTSAFNLNLLARINRELGADFNVKKFEHRAVYNEGFGRVEIYIVSQEAQKVRIPAIDLEISFDEGETIHTENSYKFDLDQIGTLARDSGFSLARTWTDRARRFSFNLFIAN
jgi:dimethylhistidine N-methyltransferase